MRHVAAVLIGVLLFVALAAPSFAAPQSVTGKVIDLACFALDRSNTGITHKGKGYDCAQNCAREGFAVGLLTTDGKIYQITGDLAANKNAKLVPHMSHTVTITGDVTEKDGQTMISASDLTMAK
jgi:hypothetical protein